MIAIIRVNLRKYFISNWVGITSKPAANVLTKRRAIVGGGAVTPTSRRLLVLTTSTAPMLVVVALAEKMPTFTSKTIDAPKTE